MRSKNSVCFSRLFHVSQSGISGIVGLCSRRQFGAGLCVHSSLSVTCGIVASMLGDEISLESLPAEVCLVGKLIKAFLEGFLYDCFSDEFAMQLQEEFDIEGGPFGLH